MNEIFAANRHPEWTHEQCVEMSRLASIAKSRKKAERLANLAAGKNSDDSRKARTLKQLDKLDKWIDAALAKGDRKEFLSLTAAKERLWKLVQPTAGCLRPGRRAAPLSQTRPTFVPDAPQAPPVPSDQPPV